MLKRLWHLFSGSEGISEADESSIDTEDHLSTKGIEEANRLSDEGDVTGAIQKLHQVLEICPKNVQALFILGQLHGGSGAYTNAIKCFEKVIELKPDSAEAYLFAGISYKEIKEYEEAMDNLFMSIHHKPDYTSAYFIIGEIYEARGKLDEAILNYKKILEIEPNYSPAIEKLGYYFIEQCKPEEGLKYFEILCDLHPEDAVTYKNFSVILQVIGEYNKAETYIRKAIRLDPSFKDAHITLAWCLAEQGNIEEGINYLDTILDSELSVPLIEFNKGMLALKALGLAEGWKGYEHGLICDSRVVRSHDEFRNWGGETLKHKSLLIYPEQGVGEEIMFSSCIPDILKLTSKVTIKCDSRLVSLFSRSFPDTVILPESSDVDSSIDFQVAVGSLPLHTRSKETDFPEHNGYIKADPVLVRKWIRKLSRLGEGLKVGISWKGGRDIIDKVKRSTSLRDWENLLQTQGIHFVNLQYNATDMELTNVSENTGAIINHWNEINPMKEFDNLAALISALDLVISIDNSTVDFTGSLGTPVWVLLPYSSSWKWATDRYDYLWYPSAHLYRQKKSRHWVEVFQIVKKDLECVAQEYSSL